MSSDFQHFTITPTTVSGTAASLSLLTPYLDLVADTSDHWFRDVVKDASTNITDASARCDRDGDPVTATFPKDALTAVMGAVEYVDRLITIMNEEIERAIEQRAADRRGIAIMHEEIDKALAESGYEDHDDHGEDSITNGTEDLS